MGNLNQDRDWVLKVVVLEDGNTRHVTCPAHRPEEGTMANGVYDLAASDQPRATSLEPTAASTCRSAGLCAGRT